MLQLAHKTLVLYSRAQHARSGEVRHLRRFQRCSFLFGAVPLTVLRCQQLPPGCTLYFGSSLWTHGNLNLIDYFTPEQIQEMLRLDCPYTAEMDAMDATVESRGSLVWFNQGSTRRTDVDNFAPHTSNRPDTVAASLAELADLFVRSWPKSES